MSDLNGLTAVVTGGNSGIGLGMARGLAKAGANVVVWARNTERSQTVTDELNELRVNAQAVACDVTSEASVQTALDETVHRMGKVDVLVASAGIADAAPLIDTTLEQWQHILHTNLDGTFLTVRAVGRHMVERGQGGSIVILSSMISRYGAKDQAAYAVSKSGLIGLGRTVAVEFARYRIRCNVLIPGWFATPMNAHLRADERFVLATTQRTPARRWADPVELEKTIAYLADPSLTFHTGDEVVVDGGYTIF